MSARQWQRLALQLGAVNAAMASVGQQMQVAVIKWDMRLARMRPPNVLRVRGSVPWA